MATLSERGPDDHLVARCRRRAGGKSFHQLALPVFESFAVLRSSSGSADVIVGTSTKFDAGAGEVVAHSMVWPSYGSSAASGLGAEHRRGEQADERQHGERHQPVADEHEDVPDLQVAVVVDEAGGLVEEAGDVVREAAPGRCR